MILGLCYSIVMMNYYIKNTFVMILYLFFASFYPFYVLYNLIENIRNDKK